MPTPTVPSPCVRNCCLDNDDICLGCHRSLTEIVAWGESDDTERRAILARAQTRAETRRQAREARPERE